MNTINEKQLLLGIDVGGTHTDGVLLDGKNILRTSKVPTDHDNLIQSIHSVLQEVLEGTDPGRVTNLNLSTTLCTNAIVQDTMERVAMLVSGGPGINPSFHQLCEDFHVIPGALDHRGTEIQSIDTDRLHDIADTCRENSIKTFGVVGKFSSRNPLHEEITADALHSISDFISLGHQISGALNFPRRIATAYYNSAVWRTYNAFLNAVKANLEDFGLQPDVNIVKADGGTFPLELSRTMPVQSIFSGPAASAMGIMALQPLGEDALILDIGGTTTDIALFAAGSPLIEPDGIAIKEHPTLVRALNVHSIGIGGDSAIRTNNSNITVGPDRLGPPLAEGGKVPTLTDALNVLGRSRYKDTEASRRGLRSLAEEKGLQTEELAGQVVQKAVQKIHGECQDFIQRVNEKPVYTLHELMEGKTIAPACIAVMGGPAESLKETLHSVFSLPVTIPDYFEVANAVGAALSKITLSLVLHADTPRGKMIIPSLGLQESIPKDYSLDQAREDAVRHLTDRLCKLKVTCDRNEVQITRAGSFNMVEGFSTVGRNIRVRCQSRPGVTHTIY